MGFWSYRKQAYFILWGRLYEKFCTSLKEHATNIINYEKKKMFPLTKNKSNQDAPRCYIYGKKILETVC